MVESEKQMVYLDTCIISGLAEEDLHPEEYYYLSQILYLHKRVIIQIVTSPVAKSEIDRIPFKFRTKHEIIYNLFSDIPVQRWRSITGLSPIGIPGFGYGRVNRDYLKLQRILPDIEDAKHLYQAIRNGVHVFLTVDARTIIVKRDVVEKEFAIKLLRPSELLREIGRKRRVHRTLSPWAEFALLVSLKPALLYPNNKVLINRK
jgi:hypothetical protein